MSETIFVGQTPLKPGTGQVAGSYETLDGQGFYKISNYDLIPPFFMTIVSDSNHWMFISSNGGLSAGRQNSEHSLFPYYTDDKITDSADQTGSKSIFLVSKSGKKYLWEPFSKQFDGVYASERNLYKHPTGNQIMFEEINHDLGLTFRYGWKYAENYGFIKESYLTNQTEDCSVEILDGIQNILPYGVEPDTQVKSSNLVDAYKKNELEVATQLGMFMLSAVIVDKPVPSEALKTTTVWHTGLSDTKMLLCADQLDNFRTGKGVHQEVDIRARRGAYFVNANISLGKGGEQTWHLVAEVEQGPSEVAALIRYLKDQGQDKAQALQADVAKGTNHLLNLIGKADGLQLSADQLTASRHLSNVLFNIMRGGQFEDQYDVELADYKDFLRGANQGVYETYATAIDALAARLSYIDLLDFAKKQKNADLSRLTYEYMPLTFSRRHGDPSRPWNRFSIDTVKEDGTKNRSYEGNWRDIFQNWEALALSYPEYLISMISKFVNASTIDGYNPYRITRNGIDWEKIEPDDPWSFIGYWGDHQIIYLQKLLEASNNHHPGLLKNLLAAEEFCYANVPYRIKSYADIVRNPQDTIDFDDEVDALTEERFQVLGSDGKLIWGKDGKVLKVNLLEKLLVTLLAKLSNFIPDAGIWLNTQRPEWNDANNALVGNGVSMVTVYYIRRYVAFLLPLMEELDGDSQISEEVAELLSSIHTTFGKYEGHLATGIDNTIRRSFVDELGIAGETYRNKAYAGFSERKRSVSKGDLTDLLQKSLTYIDQTIRNNKREDNLYHAYNLVKLGEGTISIDYLYEMLEGQVAVLSAGSLGAEEALQVMYALKNSKIYREDQYSYMLYPDRQLPRFLEKNNIPADFAENSALFSALAAAGNVQLINKDLNGNFHFNGAFNNAASVAEGLNALESNEAFASLVKAERQGVLDIFEKMFNHYAFTGRSGTFYGYEGLGSIYWHMVSKLVLAIAENFHNAKRDGVQWEILGQLMEFYYSTRAGIGLNKSPDLYGAFPTDPYSHTPGNKGAQQPGMTGQVKEDVINRWFELGVLVHGGKIHFESGLLRDNEFLEASTNFDYYDLEDILQSVALDAGTLGFTYCQVPFVYHKDGEQKVSLAFSDGSTQEIAGLELSAEISQEIFQRTGKVTQVTVSGIRP
ncbi:MAG: hypothetical protein R8G66_25100 [Cytophagales bacterium]|nr:hypothetical protein [Cytophagales bacterium]